MKQVEIREVLRHQTGISQSATGIWLSILCNIAGSTDRFDNSLVPIVRGARTALADTVAGVPIDRHAKTPLLGVFNRFNITLADINPQPTVRAGRRLDAIRPLFLRLRHNTFDQPGKMRFCSSLVVVCIARRNSGV